MFIYSFIFKMYLLHIMRIYCIVLYSMQERCQAAALGWCIEFLQAFFLVADDLMDDSVTRRGQPCWFRLPEVKTIAVNDRCVPSIHILTNFLQHFLSQRK